MSTSSLPSTVAQAVSFLTRPLLTSYAPATIMRLQLLLELALIELYTPTWDMSDPTRGSGRRCLTLSPHCLPPRTVYSACLAAGVQWFDWIALLGGREFDFFVDPGCISMRLDRKGQLITIWADEIPSPVFAKRSAESRITESISQQVEARAHAYAAAEKSNKTVAQQLLEDDFESDEQIFTMIADEICAPTWMTPVLAEFPKQRSTSPMSTHSRSSSRSSNSSSGNSSSGLSFSSVESHSSRTSSDSVRSNQSRRERARQARVFVDTSRNEVTPYDGGKTTVLTGAVMLGCPPTKKAGAALRSDHAHGWRMRL